MQLDHATGWFTGVSHCPSPNCNARPDGEAISLLVIHNISLPPACFGTGKVQQFFQNRLDPNEHPYFASISHLTVSAHLFVERDGAVTSSSRCSTAPGTRVCRASRTVKAATTFPSVSSWKAPTTCPTPMPSTAPCANSPKRFAQPGQ